MKNYYNNSSFDLKLSYKIDVYYCNFFKHSVASERSEIDKYLKLIDNLFCNNPEQGISPNPSPSSSLCVYKNAKDLEDTVTDENLKYSKIIY